MDLETHVDANTRYRVVDQLAFSDKSICVLEDKYIKASLDRNSIAGFRFEKRTSFKHPVIGGILGVVMTGLPLQAWFGDPLGLWWLLLATDGRVIGSFFMFCFGLCFLWMVARRHDETWIIFSLESIERGYSLKHELAPEAVALLKEIVSIERPDSESAEGTTDVTASA